MLPAVSLPAGAAVSVLSRRFPGKVALAGIALRARAGSIDLSAERVSLSADPVRGLSSDVRPKSLCRSDSSGGLHPRTFEQSRSNWPAAQPFAMKMQLDVVHDFEQARPEYMVFVGVPMSWLRKPDSPTLVFDSWRPKSPRVVTVFKRLGLALTACQSTAQAKGLLTEVNSALARAQVPAAARHCPGRAAVLPPSACPPFHPARTHTASVAHPPSRRSDHSRWPGVPARP